MKISPVSSVGTTVGAVSAGSEAPQTMSQKIRALKMSTNATPGRMETAPVEPEVPLSDTSDPAASEATQPLSPQYAALAKQRRALQVKEREIADREKALETKSSTQGDVVTLAQLTSDPVGVLLNSGVTFEKLTDAVMKYNSGVSPELESLKAEIKALKEGVDQKWTERDTQAEEQVLAEMVKDATKLAAQGDDYELVRETHSIPLVRDLIKRTYKETGEVLDVRDALKFVEDELINDSLKIARIQKVQKQMAPPPAPVPPQQHRQMRTLTNRDTATPPLSAKQRAMAAFNGTLKK